MMYIHSTNEIDERVNVSKIANDTSTLGDDSTAAVCNSRLITVLVQCLNLHRKFINNRFCACAIQILLKMAVSVTICSTFEVQYGKSTSLRKITVPYDIFGTVVRSCDIAHAINSYGF